MKNILSLLLVLVSLFSFGQVDTELIKKKVTENPQENFYPLLETFKSDPAKLSQEQLNQLYYGSKFVKIAYTIGDYNRESDTFWKPAQKKLSKSKAEKIRDEAESKYLKNPLNKNLLNDMINIYSALDDREKADLCTKQKELITQTIKNSGDGTSEETAVCIINPAEIFLYLEELINAGPKGEFTQKIKQLPDGSILQTYKIGDRQKFVKIVGGYFL